MTKHTYTHMYMNRFAVHLKLTQHHKPTILQFLKCPGETSFLRNNMRGPGRIQSEHLAMRSRRRRAPKWSSQLGGKDHRGEGNDTPLQYFCLENPTDGGAWKAAVHGVAQSRTRLKRLSSSSSNRQLPPKQAPKSLQMVTAAMKLKDVCSLEEKL